MNIKNIEKIIKHRKKGKKPLKTRKKAVYDRKPALSGQNP
jgi:hypothetical protein